MSKSRDAFRTISEVSDLLDTPAHVLRFWESKFTQVKPVKRAGGRRYYRPADADLLAGIKQLLHDDGMTIKGAQKLLREKGIKHVAAIGATNLLTQDAPKDVTPQEDAPAAIETKSLDTSIETAPAVEAEAPKGETEEAEVDITNVVPLDSPPADGPALTLNLGTKPEQEPEPTPQSEPEVQTTAPDTADEPQPAAIFIPDDPADSDSKAPARLFHLMQHASHDKLAQQAEAIAPLLDRMQILRDRIAAR